MRKISTLLGAAAIGAVTTTGTSATTVQPGSDPLEFFDRLTHETMQTQGDQHLGQVRITPEASHAAGAPQVYAVRDENDKKQCIIGSHLAKKSTAYTDEAFYHVMASGSLAALNPSTAVDITTLTRNGAYAYPANTTPEDGFFRTNAGFGIDKAVVFVDGKMLDLTSSVEGSHYTTKAQDAINDTIQAAYLDGKSVTYVYLSDNGHTVVDTFNMDKSVIATFDKCLETIDAIAIPQNDYVTFESIPFPKATPEIISQIKGSQCISGLKDEDVVDVRTIQSVTGAILPFSYSLVLKNGDEVVSDFFKKTADGKMYLSQSLTQFADHKISSCAGNLPVAQPPQLMTSFYLPSTPSFNPPILVIYPPGGGTTPPGGGGGGGGGCVVGCTPPPPCKDDCGPAPVPLPLGGLMLLGGLGMLGGFGLRRKKGPSLDL